MIVTGDDIPAEFLENAKRIGQEALKVLPQLTTPEGQPIGMTLIRTDVGCSDSQVHDRDTNWDPNMKTFFLNEIEYGGTTYFIRHLKFDSIPMWAELYAMKSREIHEKMVEAEPARGLGLHHLLMNLPRLHGVQLSPHWDAVKLQVTNEVCRAA